MARRLRTDLQIDTFIDRVINEAIHHAPNVAMIIQPLSDAVRRRIDLSIDRVEVYERNGRLARTCWVTISNNRYAFSYNYNAGKIDLRERGIQGQILYQFDNRTSPNALQQQVRRL